MGVWQSFLIALDMLRLHKLRAFLTMLGVIIGVMAVSLIVLVSGAFNAYLAAEFNKIGSDTIFVAFAPRRLERGKSVGEFDSLTLDDIDYLQQRTGGAIELASGYRMAGEQTLRAGENEAKDVRTTAIDENFVELNRIELVSGRQFTKQDSQLRSSVAIISENVEKTLFPKGSAIGQLITVRGLTLEVIGVTKPTEVMGQRNTETLLIPLATANSKLLGGDRVDLILCRAKKGMNTNAVMDQIWRALMVKSGNREIYSVESSENVLKVFQRIVSTIGIVLSGIAALSLLVGGIGIMNIMLVSVTERTREVGLRKALGARRPAILTQFLVESATLSIVGGLIGMFTAYMFSLLITALTKQLKWPNESGLVAPFPFEAAMYATIISGAIGCIFGLYPAIKASSLDPIVALRTE